MKVINHMLVHDNGISVLYRKSPNVGGVIKPLYLIIHYDASSSAEGAISWMTTKRKTGNVSAHLHIDRKGNIVQMVPFNISAWHAGVSEWKGLVGLNSHSIGIELLNTGTQEYTPEQIKALTEVAEALVEEYKLKEILGHSDISPGRKIDPGKQFPMAKLRSDIYGSSADIVTAKVSASKLNLRSGAGVGYPVIAELSIGTTVNVLQKKESWSEVFISSRALKGWVSNQYLK